MNGIGSSAKLAARIPEYVMSFSLKSTLQSAVLSLALVSTVKASETLDLDVYKSPTCGCCTGWVDHANGHGLVVTSHNTSDLSGLKQYYGIAPAYRSCHTAVSAEGYVFEGHVPARLVESFLQNPPAGAMGLTVPAMPVGSPGMEMGDKFMPYQVLQLNQDGTTTLFADITDPSQQY